jgi:hypothetical protein
MLVSLQGLLFSLGLFPLTYTILFVSERLRGRLRADISWRTLAVCGTSSCVGTPTTMAIASRPAE